MFKIMEASCTCAHVVQYWPAKRWEPNLKSWQAMFNEKEIIFAAGVNSHNSY